MPKKSKRKTVRQKHAAPKRESPINLSLPEKLEQVLISGDLTPLTVEERLSYYKLVCKSLGLNPLTLPFAYIFFKETDDAPAKLVLYARKDCTEQLRKIHRVSVLDEKETIEPDFITVAVRVRDKTGREDTGLGVIPLSQWSKKRQEYYKLTGNALANARMKCSTKAKRRATLSICGLGILDVSELDTMTAGVDYFEISPGGRMIRENGEFGSKQAAEAVAERQIRDHEEGKPISSQTDKYAQETISAIPWKEGRLALTGTGLNVLKSEVGSEAFKEIGIVFNVADRVTHMPLVNWFILQDRAAKCGIAATLLEAGQR